MLVVKLSRFTTVKQPHMIIAKQAYGVIGGEEKIHSVSLDSLTVTAFMDGDLYFWAHLCICTVGS